MIPEFFRCLEPGLAGILVKAVAEITSTEVDSATMVQIWQLPLCADRIQGENRMVVSRRIENSGWVDEISAVERDEIVLSLGHALQGIHPVVGRSAAVLGAIPMGAGRLARQYG